MDNRKAPQGGDENRGTVLLALSWPLVTLSLICCCARCYSRAVLTRKMWWDDWTILCTLVSYHRHSVDVVHGV